MLKYQDFKLIDPDKKQNDRIKELIELKNGSIFHEKLLNKIVEKNFKTKFYFFVNNPNNINNFSPIHLTKSALGLKQYHFKPLFDIPYAGFIDDKTINFDNISIGMFESFVYSGFPFFNRTQGNDYIKNFGETSMIDLSFDEDYIFNNIIQSKRRNMIRKGIKSGIKVKKYFTINGLKYLWPLLKELHFKLGYTHLKFDYYKDLINEYGYKNQACILIAFKNEIPISGIFILGNKNYMLYYKGSSRFGVKNEGHGELLQWEAIKVVKSLGTKYYDLGNLDKQKLPHIYRFKVGISNNIVQFPIYSKNSLGFKVVNKINRIFD